MLPVEPPFEPVPLEPPVVPVPPVDPPVVPAVEDAPVVPVGEELEQAEVRVSKPPSTAHKVRGFTFSPLANVWGSIQRYHAAMDGQDFGVRLRSTHMGTGSATLTHRVGRLIETRITGVLTLEDVAELRAGFLAVYASGEGKFLSAIDVRQAVVLARDHIAKLLLQLFTDSNPRIERSAILVGADALAPVQAEALILQARHPGRRVFRDAEAFVAYLAEVATPEEIARLREFLDEAPAPSAA
jgi:hypothetical protein